MRHSAGMRHARTGPRRLAARDRAPAEDLKEVGGQRAEDRGLGKSGKTVRSPRCAGWRGEIRAAPQRRPHRRRMMKVGGRVLRKWLIINGRYFENFLPWTVDVHGCLLYWRAWSGNRPRWRRSGQRSEAWDALSHAGGARAADHKKTQFGG